MHREAENPFRSAGCVQEALVAGNGAGVARTGRRGGNEGLIVQLVTLAECVQTLTGGNRNLRPARQIRS